MNKLLAFLFLLTLLTYPTINIQAQNGELWYVVGSNGGFVQPAPSGPSLHYTIGEMMVEHFSGANVQLSQGFHQVTYQVVMPVDEVIRPDWQVQVFPNPVSGQLTLLTDTPLEARLFDILGREVLHIPLQPGENHAELSHLPAGSYPLHLCDEAGAQSTSFIIQVIR